MDGGHQALFHAEGIVDNFSKGCQAVGCARSVGDDGDVGLVRFVVDAHHEHGSIGRGG